MANVLIEDIEEAETNAHCVSFHSMRTKTPGATALRTSLDEKSSAL